MNATKNIAVFPPPCDAGQHRLFRCLAAAFGVRFDPIVSLDLLQHDAVVLLADSDGTILKSLSAITSVYSSPGKSAGSLNVTGVASFANIAELDQSLSGISLACTLQNPIQQSELPGFTAVVRIGDLPIWAINKSHAFILTRTSLPLPNIAENEEIIDILHETYFLYLLPFVDFLRRLTEQCSWIRPTLRATLIIDDPNLHHRCYGCIDYDQLSSHARQTGYHACMATVPFDGWLNSSKAVEIFTQNTDVLSLAVHGNDHELKELAKEVSTATSSAIIAQALRRVERIEQVTKLRIDRIMVPPHGAINSTFLDVMARSGFQGATTTRSSIWKYNDHDERLPGSGMGLAEVVCGVPIVHRFRFKSDRLQQRIAISAYLKQPLIAYGHHEDFADGIASFENSANQINRLGARWTRPSEIFASNFEYEDQGTMLKIRPFSRSINVSTMGCINIQMELDGWPNQYRQLLAITNASTRIRRIISAGDIIEVSGMREVTIELLSHNPIDYQNGHERRTSFPSALRRLISETRDRAFQLRF